MREKERRGNVTILLPHLCFRVAPCSSYRESPILSLSYTSENFSLQNLACIFQRWASSNCPRSSWVSMLDAHPLSFLLSFHKLITLEYPLHGNPYTLTLISIDGHLHSPLIRLVDVRLSSPPFCLLHNHHSIPPIVLYPWLTLMYCVKIEKVLKKLEYETIAWLVIGVVHDLNTLCGEDGAQPDYMILQG